MVETITHGAQECLSAKLSHGINVNKGDVYFPPSNEVITTTILKPKNNNAPAAQFHRRDYPYFF